jgi:hypothetical protein
MARTKREGQGEVDTCGLIERAQKCESRHREEQYEGITLQPWIRMTEVGEDEGKFI